MYLTNYFLHRILAIPYIYQYVLSTNGNSIPPSLSFNWTKWALSVSKGDIPHKTSQMYKIAKGKWVKYSHLALASSAWKLILRQFSSFELTLVLLPSLTRGLGCVLYIQINLNKSHRNYSFCQGPTSLILLMCARK